MARQILPIAGQIIGGMVGGPVGAAIGGAIGGALGAYVDPLRHQGPKLGEARAQTAQEGVYRPLVFGTGCVSGNIIHRSERKVVVHRESAGGKGNRDTVDTERGYRTFAIRIAEAHTPEGYALLRIWENETLVYDVRPESEILAESEQYGQKFRFYSGTQNQLPDPDLEAYMGVGNVNSYRGSSYIVFGNYDLTDYGDMIPQYRFEVSSSASASNAFAMSGNSGKVYIADDPLSWSESLSIPVPNTRGMYVGGGVFTIIGQSEGMASTDGQNFLPISGLPTAGVDQGHIGVYCEYSGLWLCGSYSNNHGRIYRSLDGFNYTESSAEWIQFLLAPTLGVCIANIVLFSAGTEGLWRSSDGGYTFNRVSAPWPGLGGATSLVATRSGFVASATDGKIYKSSSGLSWTEVGSSPYIGGSTVGGSAYDPQSGIVCIVCNQGVTLWSPNDGSGPWAEGVNNGLSRVSFNNSSNNLAYYKGWFLVAETNAGLSGEIRAAHNPAAGPWITVKPPEFGGNIRGLMVGQGAYASESVMLSDVVRFLHARAGALPHEADVSQLIDDVDGVVFADGYTARDAIVTLLPIYNADASEYDQGSGYRINYIKRGAPVVRTLTVDDLVDEPEETVREDPMERPRVLHLAFESPITGYTAAKASIQRLSPDVKLVNEVSTYVPVTFKDVDEAWQRADVQMRVAWTEVHGERTFSIADDHLDLVPTDVIALSLRGQVHRLRVQEVEYADGVMKLEAIADRQSNYTSNVTGIPLPAPEPPPPSLMGPAVLAILDIPAISDQHDRLGYYVAVCGTTEAYAGAVIQRQQNGEWADVVSLGRNQRAIMGVLENTVPAASPHYTDTTNIVSVALYMDDELESLSDSQWLNKGGAFALETAAGWEIMQYRDVEQDSNGVWHLKYLARGRLNTDPDEHLPGARFVLLDDVHFVDADVGMIGEPLTLRAAAVGRSPETADPQTITYQGNSQREFPCAHITAEVDSDGLSMTCVPRDRFGTEQHPVRSINHDGFRWTATDGSSTVTADTDTANASLDVSGLSLPITATVAQLNRFTGAGPEISEQIE